MCSVCPFTTDNIDDVVYYLSDQRLPLEFIIDEVDLSLIHISEPTRPY